MQTCVSVQMASLLDVNCVALMERAAQSRKSIEIQHVSLQWCHAVGNMKNYYQYANLLINVSVVYRFVHHLRSLYAGRLLQKTKKKLCKVTQAISEIPSERGKESFYVALPSSVSSA